MQQSYRRSCDNDFWQQLYSCVHMKCLHFQHPVQNEMFLPDTLCLCFNMKMRLTISVSTRMSLEIDSVVSLISEGDLNRKWLRRKFLVCIEIKFLQYSRLFYIPSVYQISSFFICLLIYIGFRTFLTDYSCWSVLIICSSLSLQTL